MKLRLLPLLCLALVLCAPAAFALNPQPTNALSFVISGFGGLDQKAVQRIRLAIGQGVADNSIERYIITSYDTEGGIQGCVQASQFASSAKFQRFAKKLASIKYDFRTTAYSAEYLLRCADLPASPTARVLVYKYDGRKQCESFPGTPAEVMGQELESQGIGIYSAENVLDGFLHNQVCGAHLGYINRYSIATADLELAKLLGFLLWVP